MLKIKEINQICSMVKTCCGKKVGTVNDITEQDLNKSIERIKKRRASKDAEQLMFLNEALEQLHVAGTLVPEESKSIYKKRLIIASHTSEEELEKRKKLYRYIFTDKEMQEILSTTGDADANAEPAECAEELYNYLSSFAGSSNAECLRSIILSLNNTSYDTHVLSLRQLDQKAAERRRSRGVGADPEQAIREGWIKATDLFANERPEMFADIICTAQYPEVCSVIGPDMEIQSAEDYQLAVQALTEDLQDSDPSLTQGTAEQILKTAARVFGTVLPKETGAASSAVVTPEAIERYLAAKANVSLDTIEKRLRAFDVGSKATNIKTLDQYRAVKQEYRKIFDLLSRVNDEIGSHDEPAFNEPIQRFNNLTVQLQTILQREELQRKSHQRYLEQIQANYERAAGLYRTVNSICITLANDGVYDKEAQKAHDDAVDLAKKIHKLNKELLQHIDSLTGAGIPFPSNEKAFFAKREQLRSLLIQFQQEEVYLDQWQKEKKEHDCQSNSEKIGEKMLACLGGMSRLGVGLILLAVEKQNQFVYFYGMPRILFNIIAIVIGIACFLIGCYLAGERMGTEANEKLIRLSYPAAIALYWVLFIVCSIRWNVASLAAIILNGIIFSAADIAIAYVTARKLESKAISLGKHKSEEQQQAKLLAS